MEKKFNKKTLPEAINVYKTTQANPTPAKDSLVSIEDLQASQATFKQTRETCVKCEEGLEKYRKDNYDEHQLTIDGDGNLTNTSGTIVVPQNVSSDFTFHSKIFLRTMRKLFDISITPKNPADAYLLPFIQGIIQINHEEIAKQYTAGTLPSEVSQFLDAQLTQLKACGVAYTPKKKGGNGNASS